MDTFIVRIYRRVAEGSLEPAGTVEHVETGERVGFTDAKELLVRLLGTNVQPCISASNDDSSGGSP